MVDLTLPDAHPAQDAGEAARRLVARVLAWQHSHPLARRIAAGEVVSLGVIALPYGAGAAPQALFHQPSLLPGLSHRALLDFAARYAVTYRPGPADWPQRDIERADAAPEPAPITRYLLTAALQDPGAAGGLMPRVLLAPEGAAIWGRRPLSRQRIGVAALALAAVLAAAGLGLKSVMPHRTAAVDEVAGAASMAAPSSSPASEAVAIHTAASEAAVSASPVAAGPASAAKPDANHAHESGGTAVADAASAASAARAAQHAAPSSSQPAAHVATRAASAASEAGGTHGHQTATASAAASVVLPASAPVLPPPRLLPMPKPRFSAAASAASSAAAAASAASAPTPASTGPHFALVSMPAKKRTGAEQTLTQINTVLGPAIGDMRAQVMPSPEGFVVTLWPLSTQADAEHLAEVLRRRGVPMRWMEF